MVKRGRGGVAVFRRADVAVPYMLVNIERGAQLMTKESAWGVRVVKFTLNDASTG